MRAHIFDTTILGGLPVTVEARIHRAEPEIGIFNPQVEIEMIRFQGRLRKRDNKFIKGSPIPTIIESRMTGREWENLQDEALQY